MLDVGWPELLVIAIVLIVVVGPKDLPPMLRAFGKMTGRLRTMAGEFRSQFDEALKEADLDDVRKTISDAQRLNPVNSLKDAMNPLRQMGADIRNDLQKAVKSEPPKVPEMSVPEPAMKLSDEPPSIATVEEKQAGSVAEPVAVGPVKPARKPRSAKQLKGEAVSASADVTKASKPKTSKVGKTAAVGNPEAMKLAQVAAAVVPKADKIEQAPVAAKKPTAPKKTVEAAKPVAAAEPATVKKVTPAKKPAAVKKTAAQSPDVASDATTVKTAGKTAGKSKKTSDA